MFRYGIVCGLEPMPEGKPVVLRGDIQSVAQTACELGYDAIELHIKDPLQYDGRLLKRAAEDKGLQYCAIATGMEYLNNRLSLISDEGAVRAAAVQRLKEHIDLAAILQCPVVIGIMRSNIPDLSQRRKYEDYHTDALLELAAYARERNVELVVESIMRYINNYLNSVPETVDYLERLGQPNVKLHIDTHSMIIEDTDLSAAVRYSKNRLGYVHFSDSNRRYPGGGNIDFKPIMEALRDIQYQGYVAFECVPYPSPYECGKMSLAYVKALETCIQIQSF